MKLRMTDRAFIRIAQAVGVLYDDVVALARRVDSHDIEGGDLRVAVGNLAARYDVTEAQVWSTMGEVRAQERQDREEMEDGMDTARELSMHPYTFNPDLYVKGEVGGQSHVTPWSSDERNIGDFGPNTDQIADQAQGTQSDVRAEGGSDSTSTEQMHPLKSYPWVGRPNKDTSERSVKTEFPGDILKGRTR